MGYQESLRPIGHLAEAAGVRKAIEDFKDSRYLPDYCHYACATRERSTNKLFVVVIGQRFRVHMIAPLDICEWFPWEGGYSDYYEDLDEGLVDEAAREHPDLADKAYQEVAAIYLREEQKGREKEEAARRQALELWPSVAKVFLRYGPVPMRLFSALPLFQMHLMESVFAVLEREGLVMVCGFSSRKRLWMTERAFEQLGIEAVAFSPKENDEIIKLLLEDCGPMSTSQLARAIGRSTSYVRTTINELKSEGSVTTVGVGKNTRHCLPLEAAAS